MFSKYFLRETASQKIRSVDTTDGLISRTDEVDGWVYRPLIFLVSITLRTELGPNLSETILARINDFNEKKILYHCDFLYFLTTIMLAGRVRIPRSLLQLFPNHNLQ
jgi:hypothetical protein